MEQIGFYCKTVRSTCFGHHYAHYQELKMTCKPKRQVPQPATICINLELLKHPTNRTHNPQLHTRPTTCKPKRQIPQAAGRFHPFTGHEGPQGQQRYSSTLFQTSALEGGEGSASRPGSTLPPGKTRYLFTGGRVGPRDGLDWCGKSRPHGDSVPGPSSPQVVAIPTTLPGPTHRQQPSV